MNISVKQLESVGIGVIRDKHIKNTFKGRIYAATAYYDKDKAVDIMIIYYRNGGSKILGPVVEKDEDLNNFKNFLNYLIPILPKNSRTTQKFAGWGTAIAALVTTINLITMTGIKDIGYIITDLILTIALLVIYKKERRRA